MPTTPHAVTDIAVEYDTSTRSHRLDLTFDDGTVVSHPVQMASTDLVSLLDGLSVDVLVTPHEREKLADELFTTVVSEIAQITGPCALNPRDGDADTLSGSELAQLIDRIVITVNEYENGYFPTDSLDSLELYSGAALIDTIGDYREITALGSDAYPALTELAGPFRHDPDWAWTLHRPAPAVKTPVPTEFWEQISHQIRRLVFCRSFESIREVLLDPAYTEITAYVNQNGPRTFSLREAFFAGTGGKSILPALIHAGWDFTDIDQFHWLAIHPQTRAGFEYIEGDLIKKS